MRRGRLLLLAALAFPVLLGTRLARSADFMILCNAQNSVASLSPQELKRLATGGTKQWPDGAVVQLGLVVTDAPETAHLAALVGMTPRELIQRIQEQVFKGEMRRPVVLRSAAECVAFARAVRGGFCVAPQQLVPPGVHVLLVR